MSLTKTSGNLTSLAAYIRDELFENWKTNRQKNLEPKWQRNYEAFMSLADNQWKVDEGEGWRSSTFFPLTKMKVVAAWSIVIDLELQSNRLPFMLIASPEDQLNFEKLPPDQRRMLEAEISAAEDLIHQQFEDCHADRHVMKANFSRAIYGESYLKRYIAEVDRSTYQMSPYGRWEKVERFINSPALEYCSIWEIYRDLETDDIQQGTGIIQRRMTSMYQVRQLIGQPFYSKQAILRAIEQAAKPGSAESYIDDTSGLPPHLRDLSHRQNTMQRLEFWGRAPRKLVLDQQKYMKKRDSYGPTEQEAIYDGDEVEVHVTMVDDEIARMVPVPKGITRPYYRSVWEINLDGDGGTGVADNIEPIQSVLNGLIRAYEDNKKLSSNIIFGIKRQFLDPNWDGKFRPGMLLEVLEECEDVRKALQPFIVPDVGESLLNGIGLFERFGDEVSALPRILQGELVEKKKPDTAFEMNQLQANAGKYLGGVIRNDDEGHFEPAVTDFFHYNMANPEVKRGKGNFIAKALGFNSFQARVEKQRKILQFLQLVFSNEALMAEVKTRKAVEEFAKSLDLDKDELLKTVEEKQAEMQERMQSGEYQMQIAAMQTALQETMAKIERMRAETENIRGKTQNERAITQIEAVDTMAKHGAKKKDQALKQLKLGADIVHNAAMLEDQREERAMTREEQKSSPPE